MSAQVWFVIGCAVVPAVIAGCVWLFTDTDWRRVGRAARMLAKDARLPRWLKGLILVGFLPIPGPVDELVAAAAIGLAWVLYRPLLRDAWQRAA